MKRLLRWLRGSGANGAKDDRLRGAVVYGDGSNITVGENVALGGVFLFGTERIEIGEYSMIGHGSIIHTSTHDHEVHPMWSKRIDRPVRIGKHVWIGTGAIIMPGVQIADYSVVAAGAVVCGHVPEGAIVAGVPATIIRRRDLERIFRGYTGEPEYPNAKVVKAGFLEPDRVCSER